jgi:hypothetical protein
MVPPGTAPPIRSTCWCKPGAEYPGQPGARLQVVGSGRYGCPGRPSTAEQARGRGPDHHPHRRRVPGGGHAAGSRRMDGGRAAAAPDLALHRARSPRPAPSDRVRCPARRLARVPRSARPEGDPRRRWSRMLRVDDGLAIHPDPARVLWSAWPSVVAGQQVDQLRVLDSVEVLKVYAKCLDGQDATARRLAFAALGTLPPAPESADRG